MSPLPHRPGRPSGRRRPRLDPAAARRAIINPAGPGSLLGDGAAPASLRWGTVTAASPLTVQLAGPGDPVAVTATAAGALQPGDRVLLAQQGTTLTAIICPTRSGGGGTPGPPGPPNILGIGTVTTGGAGSSAGATITGTSPSQTLNLTIPRGDKGDTGNTGPKGDKGDTGNTGPKGNKGDTGNTGPKGDPGSPGTPADMSRVTALESWRTTVESAWTTYTPQWIRLSGASPQPDIGNGTLTGKWQLLPDGRTIAWSLYWQRGSSTSVPTGVAMCFSLPFAAKTWQQSGGAGYFSNVGSGRTPWVEEVISAIPVSDTLMIVAIQGGRWTSALPTTQGTADRILLTGIYEKA